MSPSPPDPEVGAVRSVAQMPIRILMVDDDEDDYFLTRDLLAEVRAFRPEIAWAPDYDTALEILKRANHDLYLLDYHLGAHDGLSLLEEIARRHAGAAVILLTGQDDPDVDERARRAGAFDFLVKGQINASLLERSIRYAFERKQVEERLRRREEQLRLTLMNAPLGIITCDLAGCFLSANPAIVSILGVPAAVLKRMSLPDVIAPDHVEEYRRLVRLLIEQKVDIARLERPFVRADGQRIDGILTLRLMLDRGGRPLQLVGQLEDVTERLALESRLAQAEKLKSIGQLAAGIAHEINTPIQFAAVNLRFLEGAFDDIRAYFEIEGSPAPERSGDDWLDERLQRVLAEIPEAIEQAIIGADRVSDIVRSVREFAHPQTTKHELLDLNRAVTTTLTVSANEWRHVAEVVTDLDPNLPRVACIAGEVNQVLLQLVVNAAAAISTVMAQNGEHQGVIQVRTARRDGWAEVQVSDNGCGIPEAARARVFDPFYTTKAAGPGAGQGLAIAHSTVVGRHGGELVFDSEVGRGTTFTMRLPLDS